MDRGGPVWPGVYGTSSSLQHAAQLQLLSQQQMLRQQELLMIQQHTAQVLELQRNAQLVVSRLCVVKWYQQQQPYIIQTTPYIYTPVHVDIHLHIQHKHKTQQSCSCMRLLCAYISLLHTSHK